MLRELLGLTIEQQAEEYKKRLKEDRSGIKTWNAGDMFRDVLTPGTREDLEEAAKALRVKDLNTDAITEIEAIRQTLGGTKIDTTDQALQIKPNETAAKFKSRLAGLVATGQQNIRNTGISGYDQSKVTDGMGLAGVAALGTKQTTDNTKEVTKKKDKRYDDTQRLTLMQLMQQGQRMDNQFAVQMAQQDYQNRALEMKDARLERRDRQAAIQQMMAGLATMGASIAI